MRTVGQILKEEREKRFYTLDEVEKTTKIRKELLEALEQDNWAKLPPPTFIQGFIRNYCKFLAVEEEKVLAIFRREFSDKKNPPQILDALSNPLDKKRFFLTPPRVFSGLVIGMLVVFFSYLWFEYRFLMGPPFLEVIEPKGEQSIEIESVKVKGKTDPEAKVTVNNQGIPVDIKGNFSQELKVSESVNVIVVTATSKNGKITKIERTVYLKE